MMLAVLLALAIVAALVVACLPLRPVPRHRAGDQVLHTEPGLRAAERGR